MEPQTYDIGEVVLLEWQGWLKAFKVIEKYETEHAVDYKLEMLDEKTSSPGWIRPAS